MSSTDALKDPKDRIIVALDVPDVGTGVRLVEQLAPHVGLFKIGLELITKLALIGLEQDIMQQSAVSKLFALLGNNIFWDGKWDDIPNTVGGAAKVLQKLNPRMLNVHASAGIKAIQSAVEHRGESMVLGVTVLTSLDSRNCHLIFGDVPELKVLQFAQMLLDGGAQGMVCSPQELLAVRKYKAHDSLKLVIPGIRPADSAQDDQSRIATPGQAIFNGADYLVIGRPITQAPDPVAAAQAIAAEIGEALAAKAVV